MSLFGRFGLLPLATAIAGVSLAVPTTAGAQTAADPPAADPPTAEPCDGVFEAQINSRFALTTDPPPRSDARPGQTIQLNGSWPTTAWDSISSLVSCVEVANHVDPSLGGGEDAPVNDGAFSHTFAVPEGLFNGTVICTRMRMAGDPAGEAIEAVWVGKQACFEVHPEEAPAPAPSPTPAPTSPPPPPAPAEPAGSTPPPARPAPDAGAGSPAVPLQDTTQADAPADGFREGEGEIPGADAKPEPGKGPIPLGELPRTGFGAAALVDTGVAALALGLPAVIAGRRRRR